VGTGFNTKYFESLAALEDKNFWFKIRNIIILWSIRKYVSNPASFLEIGCGTGFVTLALSKAFPQIRLTSSEFFEEGLVFARKRISGVEFIQLDAREIPYESKFHSIGAFDVLEHIKEDEIVLRQIHKALMPGGFLFLTVPQHQWLWSSLDECACHERRYSAKTLHKIVSNAGFEIIQHYYQQCFYPGS